MKSKAMVAVDKGKLELKTFDLPDLTSNQVLLKVGATSVCASDPKILSGQSPFTKFPIIMGHEFAGTVAEIGKEAALSYKLKKGDRITVEPSIPCGSCSWCKDQHSYHKCRPLRAYGVTMSVDEPPHLLGGYAEYLYLMPGSLVYKIADNIADISACLSSVIGNGVRWIKTMGQMTFGQSLVVSGAGSQGMATVIAAIECGVGPVIMLGLERDKLRFELAREFGVHHVINIDKEDPLKMVPELLGKAPDVVVETSGVPSAIQMAIKLVRPMGKVISIGLSKGKPTPLVFDDLVVKGITIMSDHAQAGNMADAMKIINSGKYKIEKINNFSYNLEDLPKALEDTQNPPLEFIKGVIKL